MTDLEEIENHILNNKLEFNYGYADKIENYNGKTWVLENSKFKKYKQYSTTLHFELVAVSYYKNYTIVREYTIDEIFSVFSFTLYLYRDVKLKLWKKLPYLNSETFRIHELILKWGDKSDNFIGRKLELSGIPHACKTVKKVLYRGLQNLSLPAFNKIIKGKPITLENRPYSSWTYSLKKAKNFSGNGIVFSFFPKNEVIIDVNSFEKIVFGYTNHYKRYDEYEVICKNSPKMLIVHPDQIVFKELPFIE